MLNFQKKWKPDNVSANVYSLCTVSLIRRTNYVIIMFCLHRLNIIYSDDTVSLTQAQWLGDIKWTWPK